MSCGQTAARDAEREEAEKEFLDQLKKVPPTAWVAVVESAQRVIEAYNTSGSLAHLHYTVNNMEQALGKAIRKSFR